VINLSGWWCNNHLEKYDFVNGKDNFPYMKLKIKNMFETTNQLFSLNTNKKTSANLNMEKL